MTRTTYTKRRLVAGVGVNDYPYQIKPDGILLPAYDVWASMLKRCYKKYAKTPTYRDCTVCDEWLSFSAFKSWYDTQYKESGWQLDKDLIHPNNRVYCPEYCIFVPQWLNSFTTDHRNASGEYPIGVHKQADGRNKPYCARCQDPETHKRTSLGHFSTPEEAHSVWKSKKLEYVERLKPVTDGIDTRIYTGLVKRYS